jgi:hypothetical protein
MAELQEADATRKRRKSLRNAEIQAQNDAELEQYTAEASSRQDEVADEFFAQPLQSNDVIWLSSGSEVSQNAEVDAGVDSDSTGFLDIDDLIAIHSRQQQHQKSVSPVLTAPSSSRPARARKPTAKQASQNRRAIEKQGREKDKTKMVDTTQLQEYELPFRSSQ